MRHTVLHVNPIAKQIEKHHRNDETLSHLVNPEIEKFLNSHLSRTCDGCQSHTSADVGGPQKKFISTPTSINREKKLSIKVNCFSLCIDRRMNQQMKKMYLPMKLIHTAEGQ